MLGDIRFPKRNSVFLTDFNYPNMFNIYYNFRIQISSRMWDASLVLDGGSSFRFNDGAIATLEILDEDALRTVELD